MVLAVSVFGGLLIFSLVQFINLRTAHDPDTFDQILEYLPAEDETWEVNELPIEETEAIGAATIDVLGSDHIIHREYKKSATTITVFIVHWSAKNSTMPREIAFHSPDHCWSRTGFKRTMVNDYYLLENRSEEVKAGKYREFKSNYQTHYVLYWQMFGEEVLSFTKGDEVVPSDKTVLDDFFSGRAFKAEEQYFIRITSNVKFGQLSSNPMLNRILTSLSIVGLSVSTQRD